MSPSAPPTAEFPAWPPLWAEVFGEDDRGLFAECTVQEALFVWRWLPPGAFLMGSPREEEGRYDDEGPQHLVTLTRGFWLGETPVTQAQWQALMGKDPSRFKGPEHPVEQISWHEAVDFAVKLNATLPGLAARLPTEAEWENACRAGQPTAFNDGSPCTQPSGKDPALDQLGWFDENSASKTHPVREKKANARGLYDMHGNVWEWCLDGMRPYTEAPQTAPLGTQEPGAFRVLRGGTWLDPAQSCRAACRRQGPPGSRWSVAGFRLAAGQESGAAEPQGPGG